MWTFLHLVQLLQLHEPILLRLGCLKQLLNNYEQKSRFTPDSLLEIIRPVVNQLALTKHHLIQTNKLRLPLPRAGFPYRLKQARLCSMAKKSGRGHGSHDDLFE